MTDAEKLSMVEAKTIMCIIKSLDLIEVFGTYVAQRFEDLTVSATTAGSTATLSELSTKAPAVAAEIAAIKTALSTARASGVTLAGLASVEANIEAAEALFVEAATVAQINLTDEAMALKRDAAGRGRNFKGYKKAKKVIKRSTKMYTKMTARLTVSA